MTKPGCQQLHDYCYLCAQLASYKVASHATAQRAVLAARRALQELPDETTPGMSMEGESPLRSIYSKYSTWLSHPERCMSAGCHGHA